MCEDVREAEGKVGLMRSVGAGAVVSRVLDTEALEETWQVKSMAEGEGGCSAWRKGL
jgi:hypothetical protein